MRPAPVTAEELAEITRAERIGKLRSLPEFNRILMVMEAAVDAALRELEMNDVPRLDAIYKLRWRERKFMLDSINSYIDTVAAQRKDTVMELLREMGITDPDLLEKNADMTFAQLNPDNIFGGPNGKQR